VTLRAVRGATQVDRDERDHVLLRSRELVREVMRAIGLTTEDMISVVFTATRDICSVAPALAARQLGLNDVALVCAQEMHVSDSMPLVVRLLAHIDTGRSRADIENVYLHGTDRLRADVPPIPNGQM
jgi:chorismate mutase